MYRVDLFATCVQSSASMNWRKFCNLIDDLHGVQHSCEALKDVWNALPFQYCQIELKFPRKERSNNTLGKRKWTTTEPLESEAGTDVLLEIIAQKDKKIDKLRHEIARLCGALVKVHKISSNRMHHHGNHLRICNELEDLMQLSLMKTSEIIVNSRKWLGLEEITSNPRDAMDFQSSSEIQLLAQVKRCSGPALFGEGSIQIFIVSVMPMGDNDLDIEDSNLPHCIGKFLFRSEVPSLAGESGGLKAKLESRSRHYSPRWSVHWNVLRRALLNGFLFLDDPDVDTNKLLTKMSEVLNLSSHGTVLLSESAVKDILHSSLSETKENSHVAEESSSNETLHTAMQALSWLFDHESCASIPVDSWCS